MDIQNCIVCESHNTRKLFYLKSNGLSALKCRKCGHVFINNSPINSDNISDYYTMDDYTGKRQLQSEEWYTEYYSNCFSNYEDNLISSFVLKQFQEKADFFEKQFPQGGRLLDVGCATGVFLDMMQKRGWEVEGTEVSEELASYARKTFSLKIHLKDLTKEELEADPYDAITLFDVIEHIPNPNLLITACRNLLKPDGLLLLRTPTEEGLFRDIAKVIYAGSLKKIEFPMLWFFSFEHLHSFSLKTLTYLLEKHQFVVKKVFREEESLERINVPGYIKMIMKGIELVSRILRKQHKISVISRKN